MSEARFLVGDVFDRMADIPDNSVDLIVTSPPFLALRSYLPADHPDKHKEIGSEPTPAAFLSTLLALTREWRRVLTPTGSLCVELGDTYAGSGGAGGDYGPDGLRDGQPKFKAAHGYDAKHANQAGRTGGAPSGRGWPLAKSLCLLPTLYPASLAYGRNLLAPDDVCEPWRVRNLIVWHRPNPPVGALGDKVRPSTSYITTACVSDKRWFDLDSERTPAQVQMGRNVAGNNVKGSDDASFRFSERVDSNPAGAPLLDCWTIPTAPFSGAHYATFPPALPRRLINLMCPRQVCTICGEPRRRIVETGDRVNVCGRVDQADWDPDLSKKNDHDHEGSRWEHLVRDGFVPGHSYERTTLGWSDCGHDTWRRGIVLDPFAGSGTTLQAASELGRDSIGLDLDERNLDLARQRLGMFLVEEKTVP